MTCRDCSKFKYCYTKTNGRGTYYYGDDIACNDVEDRCSLFSPSRTATISTKFKDKLTSKFVKNNIYTGEEILNVIQQVFEGKRVDTAEPIKNIKKQKFAEWVVSGDGEYVPYVCTACCKTTTWYHKQTAKYCPNCGAKMVENLEDMNNGLC